MRVVGAVMGKGGLSAGRVLALSAVLVFALVMAAGWLTDARHTMCATLYAVAGKAFLPAVRVLIGVVAVLAASIIAAAAHLPPPYERLLSRVRRPALVGALVGTLLGLVGVWLMVATVVAPGEANTVTELRRVRAMVELNILDGTPPNLGRDAFGRPLRLDIRQRRHRSVPFILRSDGYDGELSDDDLCVVGSVREGSGLDCPSWSDISPRPQRRSMPSMTPPPPWFERVSEVASVRCFGNLRKALEDAVR